jgi:hypothetical protein
VKILENLSEGRKIREKTIKNNQSLALLGTKLIVTPLLLVSLLLVSSLLLPESHNNPTNFALGTDSAVAHVLLPLASLSPSCCTVILPMMLWLKSKLLPPALLLLTLTASRVSNTSSCPYY